MQILVAALLAVLVGCGMCFYGYRLFMVLLPIWGFFAGLWLGLKGVQLVMGGGFLGDSTGILVGLILGVIAAMLSYMFYFLGVFIVAASFGVTLGFGLTGGLLGMETGTTAILIALGLGLLIAVLAMILNIQKYVIIAITAVGGASLIVAGVLMLLGQVSLEAVARVGNSLGPVAQSSTFWLVMGVILALIGAWVQLRLHRHYQFDKSTYRRGWG
jgi:hypothetical protein